MKATQMAKVLFERDINGVTTLVTATTPAGNQGQYVKVLAGVGNKFWWFPSIPSGSIVGVNFTDAPTATADATVNNTLIAAITVAPTDVITYA